CIGNSILSYSSLLDPARPAGGRQAGGGRVLVANIIKYRYRNCEELHTGGQARGSCPTRLTML
ncbi:MAG: hypothetical protein NTV06_09355, partial [candidate division Zixibacteria bacterium]|nr:hypothetical protein [candidate division Zixibacteria bacterium]